MAPEVITALSSMAAAKMLPINCARPLEGTLAAAFVLCQRANLKPALLATQPELLMAVFWILEQYNRHASSPKLASQAAEQACMSKQSPKPLKICTDFLLP